MMRLEKLRELYPDLSEEELTHAAENLDRYLMLAWDIYAEMEAGGSGGE